MIGRIGIWFSILLPKGPFKYYVIKKVGGWVQQNDYVFLQGGWVGMANCLRNTISITGKKDFLKKTF